MRHRHAPAGVGHVGAVGRVAIAGHAGRADLGRRAGAHDLAVGSDGSSIDDPRERVAERSDARARRARNGRREYGASIAVGHPRRHRIPARGLDAVVGDDHVHQLGRVPAPGRYRPGFAHEPPRRGARAGQEERTAPPADLVARPVRASEGVPSLSRPQGPDGWSRLRPGLPQQPRQPAQVLRPSAGHVVSTPQEGSAAMNGNLPCLVGNGRLPGFNKTSGAGTQRVESQWVVALNRTLARGPGAARIDRNFG